MSEGNWASHESAHASFRDANAFARELREAIEAVDCIKPQTVEVGGMRVRIVPSPAMPPDEFVVVDSNFGRWRFRTDWAR